ncbi:hypothetical protein RJ55_02761 [Drechmeria coniospora]|nr:hypothetical protein RJ55_02761 [Drechmeria coniospora]
MHRREWASTASATHSTASACASTHACTSSHMTIYAFVEVGSMAVCYAVRDGLVRRSPSRQASAEESAPQVRHNPPPPSAGGPPGLRIPSFHILQFQTDNEAGHPSGDGHGDATPLLNPVAQLSPLLVPGHPFGHQARHARLGLVGATPVALVTVSIAGSEDPGGFANADATAQRDAQCQCGTENRWLPWSPTSRRRCPVDVGPSGEPVGHDHLLLLTMDIGAECRADLCLVAMEAQP